MNGWEKTVRIAIDAMGGDYAPQEIVQGALLARAQLGVDIVLVGSAEAVLPELRRHNAAQSVEIVDAPEQVGMGEEPTIVRRKPNSSIMVTMDLVKQGRAEAAVAAGNTGAAMAAALFRIGRLPGIERPAIGAMLPTLKLGKRVLLLDVGANTDSRPRFLEQFALMGALYSRYVLGVAEPKVGLLNIGEERGKGNELVADAYEMLVKNPHVPFAGNCEGRDVMTGRFDVVVCDGFMGNVLLKFAEGVGLVALQILREELPRGIPGKIGIALMRNNLGQVKQRMDYAAYGGGLLLGVNGVCIIAHGSSKAQGILSAIRLAKEALDNRVLERIQQQLILPM
ncbi:gll0800 [Gloeobacter violaceus PCC 7421]|uniref:Phosphate acyltransferase n=2 Tax=Gloeobacter violaceus TaxID=33072 RepID=PLSX_GLOVI|nr:RecName: Full=Phosphate acyltransferase; AltName: Full=Acyl-ACP phosphotransacylase; AltName: Full=Acyl-[acyl-carrier-protein]--phosphate acyltransferase; AltName: Full=Phosphate-acyl-ACP acyltransferase [Gloeobacter violaceus PCC 7421]BAC88741.1 gll0800 [Gloeobacter violaceus PCC 7421]